MADGFRPHVIADDGPGEDHEYGGAPHPPARPASNPLTRFFLRVAAIDPDDAMARKERVLFTSIGFFIIAFGGYVFAALYALLVRIGATGATLLSHGACVLAAAAIAFALAMFDRAVVSQVYADLDAMEPIDHDGRASRRQRLVEILHPMGRRGRGPLLGRALIALMVGFFASLSIEMVFFSNDIVKQRADNLTPALTKSYNDAVAHRTDAQTTFTQQYPSLAQQERELRATSVRARRGQHGLCRKGTTCATTLGQANAIAAQLKTPPDSATSAETKAVNAAKVKVEQIQDAPEKAVATIPSSPLDDTAALFSYIGHHRMALLYCIPLWVLLICLDLGALFLKYGLASKTVHERWEAARVTTAWRQAAEQIHREDHDVRRDADNAAVARDDAAQTQAKIEQLREELLRAAYADEAQSAAVVAAAHDAARDDLLRRFGAGSAPADEDEDEGGSSDETSDPPPGETASPPAPGGTTVIDKTGSSDKSLAIELLGVGAGILLLVTLLGGVYLSGQIHHARLPYDVLSAMPARRILVTGVTLAAFGAVPVILLSMVLARPILRTQRAAYNHNNGDVVAYSVDRLLGRTQADVPVAADAHSRPIPPAPLTGAAAAVSVGAAGLATENGWSALLAGTAGTSVGMVGVGLLVLFLLGRVDPNTRWFRGTVIAGLVLSTLCGAWAVGTVRPMKLAVATIKPVGHDRCMRGSYVGRDGSSYYLVDGRSHTLRVLPSDDVGAASVSAGIRPVRSTAVVRVRCPASLSALSR